MKVKLTTEKLAGEWTVGFTIGNQTFHLRTFSTSKKEANWHKKMLKIAFKNLKKKI